CFGVWCTPCGRRPARPGRPPPRRPRPPPPPPPPPPPAPPPPPPPPPAPPPQPGIVTGPPKQVVSQLQDLITHYGFTGFNFLPSQPDDLPRLAEELLPELTR